MHGTLRTFFFRVVRPGTTANEQFFPMIELAPNHKLGLVVPNPILVAGGMVGFGEAIPRGLETELLGGIVVGPILARNRIGSTPPRIAAVNGGFVRQTGLQNRGVSAIIRRFSKKWQRMGCPVIAQIAESDPDRMRSLVEKLSAVSSLSGLELLPPEHGGVELAHALLHQVLRHSDLPVWVKLPLDNAAGWARALLEEDVAGFVVGQPPKGASHPDPPVYEPFFLSGTNSDGTRCGPITGDVFGPLVFAPMLRALISVAQLNSSCGLLACGGIHSLDQVHQALNVGAKAVQIDSAVWVEPGLPNRLANATHPGTSAKQTNSASN